LSGAATMVPSMSILRKVKNPHRRNAIPAWTKFLSAGRQLKTDRTPCGSGSDLPSTKAFADASFDPIPPEDSFGLFAAVY